MSQRKKANTSIVVSTVILALLFGIRLYNRHSGDFEGDRFSQYQSMSSMDASVSSVRESEILVERTYSEIKGSFDNNIYSNVYTGLSLNIPEGYELATSDNEVVFLRTSNKEDSDVLEYNDFISDSRFVSDSGNAINIDLLYIPGDSMTPVNETAILTQLTSSLTESSGYSNKTSGISSAYSWFQYDYVNGDYSCTLTIMVSCDNSVATVITLIDTNGEDLMSAITG